MNPSDVITACLGVFGLLCCAVAWAGWSLEQRIAALEARNAPTPLPAPAFVAPDSGPGSSKHLTTVFRRDANGRVC